MGTYIITIDSLRKAAMKNHMILMYIANKGYDPLLEVKEKPEIINITKFPSKDGLGEWEEVPKSESFYYRNQSKQLDIPQIVKEKEKKEQIPKEVRAFVNAKASTKQIAFSFMETEKK